MKKDTGFTLIEVLVVIVIIGILASISTATFKKYFGKACDAERITVVQGMALTIKIDSAAVWKDNKYIYNQEALQKIFDDNDYRLPKPKKNLCYIIAMSNGMQPVGDDNEFIITTWGEETSTREEATGISGVIADGTMKTVSSFVNLINITEEDFKCNALGLGAIGEGSVIDELDGIMQGTMSYYFINNNGELVSSF